MTQIKEKAVEMIQRMPEENKFYVINILQNLEAMADCIVTRNPNDYTKSPCLYFFKRSFFQAIFCSVFPSYFLIS